MKISLEPKEARCPACGQSVVVLRDTRTIARHNLPGSWREVEPGVSVPTRCSGSGSMLPPSN
jgi:uncharacterized protein with PIN domain